MEYRLWRLAAVLLMVLGINAQLAAAPIALYDDSLENLPGDQPGPPDPPWLLFVAIGVPFTQTAVVGTGVNLVTTDNHAVSAGYNNLLNPAFPVLDRISGFRLQFELQVISESHGNNNNGNNNNRAGFSVILLASDLFGIELGFWENEIWAQSDDPLFMHAEGVSFDTTVQEVTYELTILGSSYSLAANGTPILSNALRNYSASGAMPPFYSLPNFLFLGDDTSSAGANITLGQVTLTTQIPAPSSLLLLLPGLFALIRGCPKSVGWVRNETHHAF